MAWKYVKRDFQAGDILDPADWNENAREFVEEINGYLDRDNLPPNAITPDEEVKSEVFNDFSIARFADSSTAGHLLEDNNQSFQRIPFANTLTSVSDEMLICEAMVQVDTGGNTLTAPNSNPSGTTFNDGYIHVTQKTILDWCQYELMMTLNGIEIAYAGPFTAFNRRQPVYMCGALPVEAGANTVEVFIRVYVDRNGGDTHTWDSAVTGLAINIRRANILVNRRKR